MKKHEKDALSRWSVDDSIELYGIPRWGDGLFTANDLGHVCLQSQDRGMSDIDLKSLVDEILMRGLKLPVLIRFTDILRRSIDRLNDAFSEARSAHDYSGEYRAVYPIKVNQHRHVLEDIITLGRQHHLGLECGSKPELLIAVAVHADPQSLIICNGFKDRDYIETALYSRKLGHRIYLVVEKLHELHLILDIARTLRIDPLIGIRMKLASRGKGLWETSGGARSKFGLDAVQIVEAVRILRQRRMLRQLRLLHFHIGSQISDIQKIKGALKEAASFFVGLHRMGAPVDVLDVGGGLAVDYDGSHTNFASSANYTCAEYAADVVDALAVACSDADLPHPTIVTESGRALVAHHSVLVVEAISSTERDVAREIPTLPRKAPDVVRRMPDILSAFTGKNFQETYHDALAARNEALALFSLGILSLEHRALTERFFWIICRRLYDYVSDLDYIPDDMADLGNLLRTTYYCNFSVFQSLPDHWAIKQLFPIVPLSRLDEEPAKRAVLADITCDSDGIIDRFVDLRDVRDSLPLHPLRRGEPYYLGIFLVGAYQEILGDIHNLFGDTNVVHVSSGANKYVIDKTLEGDSIVDVLAYTQFSRRDILARFRDAVENALKEGVMSLEESAPFMRRVEMQLDDYTYLHAWENSRPRK
ncbi:MAG: biosynthetic arginine decarboxylase [Planctomycetes bacterium]|nr:biosynthetic arginine decarboxylase [Planctomycetota bacterium]